MLHITNGESVIHSFTAARLEGAYLSWMDVLYEGPVPDLPHEALSDVRARALANLGWGQEAEIRNAFAARDAALASFCDHEEVVLWFEHDLFDQLQLIQLLSWFADQDLGSTRLSLVYIASHDQIPEILRDRKPVTAEQLSLGRRAWKAFCGPDPRAITAHDSFGFVTAPVSTGCLAAVARRIPVPSKWPVANRAAASRSDRVGEA